MKPGSAFVRATGLSLSLVLFVTNSLLAHAPEANLWAERKRAVQSARLGNEKKSLELAGLPSSANPISLPNLEKLPVAKPLSAGVSGRIAKSLPKPLFSKYAPLFETLPAAYGTIRKITPSAAKKSDKTIIHIQDVHMNAEAQKNIAKAVQSLIDENQVDLIALEGAFAPIDLTPFRTFPHQNTIRKVADYMLKNHKISGPIHAAFTNPNQIPPIIGVDDKGHYNANVEAYRRSAPLMKKYKKRLEKLDQAIRLNKKKTFNTELAAFDQKVEAFRNGRIQLSDYVRQLSKNFYHQRLISEDSSPRHTVGRLGRVLIDNSYKEDPIHTPPNLPIVQHGEEMTARFLQAVDFESSLNFNQVETERSLLLSKLLPKLDKVQKVDFLNHGAAYRMGTIRHADFYAFLTDLCEKNGVSLDGLPAMRDYLKYVLLAESIDAEELFKAVKRREERLYESLARSEEEKRILNESKYLYLVGKLLDFALTKEEWEEYKQRLAVSYQLSANKLDFLKADSRKRKAEGVKSFEGFYEEAEERDRAMSENLIKEMERQNKKVAVLVTGGFHSAGINRRLSEAGVTTITFVPKLTKVDLENGSAYLSVFSREKTPLEKLFEGERLFLAQTPLQPVMALCGFEGLDVLECGRHLNKVAQAYGARVEVKSKSGGDQRAKIKVNAFGETAEAEIEKNEDGSLKSVRISRPFLPTVSNILVAPIIENVFLIPLGFGIYAGRLFFVHDPLLAGLFLTSGWLLSYFYLKLLFPLLHNKRDRKAAAQLVVWGLPIATFDYLIFGFLALDPAVSIISFVLYFFMPTVVSTAHGGNNLLRTIRDRFPRLDQRLTHSSSLLLRKYGSVMLSVSDSGFTGPADALGTRKDNKQASDVPSGLVAANYLADFLKGRTRDEKLAETYLEKVKRSDDLRVALKLREITQKLNRSSVWYLYLEEAIQRILRINVLVTGKYLGLRGSVERRSAALIGIFAAPLVEGQNLLNVLRRRFPDQEIRVVDGGISSGELSGQLFNALSYMMDGRLQYLGLDLVTSLIFLTDISETTAAFTNKGDLLQIAAHDRIISIPTRPQEQSEAINGANLLLIEFFNLALQELGTRADDIEKLSRPGNGIKLPRGIVKAEQMSTFHYSALALQLRNEKFKLAQQDLRDPWPNNREPPHLIFLSNVLIPNKYYSMAEINLSIQQIGRWLADGGFLLIVNEVWMGNGIHRRKPWDLYTLYERRGDNLVAVATSSLQDGVWGFAINEKIPSVVPLIPLANAFDHPAEKGAEVFGVSGAVHAGARNSVQASSTDSPSQTPGSPASLDYLSQLLFNVDPKIAAQGAIKRLFLEGIAIVLAITFLAPHVTQVNLGILFVLLHVFLVTLRAVFKRGPPLSASDFVKLFLTALIVPGFVFFLYSSAFLAPSYWIFLSVPAVYHLHRRIDAFFMGVPMRIYDVSWVWETIKMILERISDPFRTGTKVNAPFQRSENLPQKTGNESKGGEGGDPKGVEIITGKTDDFVDFSNTPALEGRDMFASFALRPIKAQIEKLRKLLKPSVVEAIGNGKILLRGVGPRPHEVLDFLELFPNAVIYVADVSWANIQSIKTELDARNDTDHKRIKLLHTYFHQMPLPNDFLDAEFSRDVIDPTVASYDERVRWVEESKRILKPSGVYLALPTTDILVFSEQQFFIRAVESGLGVPFAAALDKSVFIDANKSRTGTQGDREATSDSLSLMPFWTSWYEGSIAHEKLVEQGQAAPRFWTPNRIVAYAGFVEEVVIRFVFVEGLTLLMMFFAGFGLGDLAPPVLAMTLSTYFAIRLLFVLLYTFFFATFLHPWIFIGKGNTAHSVRFLDWTSHDKARLQLFRLGFLGSLASLTPQLILYLLPELGLVMSPSLLFIVILIIGAYFLIGIGHGAYNPIARELSKRMRLKEEKNKQLRHPLNMGVSELGWKPTVVFKVGDRINRVELKSLLRAAAVNKAKAVCLIAPAGLTQETLMKKQTEIWSVIQKTALEAGVNPEVVFKSQFGNRQVCSLQDVLDKAAQSKNFQPGDVTLFTADSYSGRFRRLNLKRQHLIDVIFDLLTGELDADRLNRLKGTQGFRKAA